MPGPAFSNLLIVDGFATFFRFLVLAIGIVTVLSSYRYLTARTPKPANTTPCCCSPSPDNA